MRKNCGCHLCDLAGSNCPEKHPASEIVKARHINGSYYWGKKKAKGRLVNICKPCIENGFDGDESEEELNATFGIGR